MNSQTAVYPPLNASLMGFSRLFAISALHSMQQGTVFRPYMRSALFGVTRRLEWSSCLFKIQFGITCSSLNRFSAGATPQMKHASPCAIADMKRSTPRDTTRPSGASTEPPVVRTNTLVLLSWVCFNLSRFRVTRVGPIGRSKARHRSLPDPHDIAELDGRQG